MKRISPSGSLIALTLFVIPIAALSQSSAVPWSTFSGGFGAASSANTILHTSLGEVSVGTIEDGNILVRSGFMVVLQQQQSALAVEDVAGLPNDFALHQNYPNPFNPATHLEFDLPMATDIHIVVYDLLGREVVRLLNQHLEPGFHQLIWNGTDRTGRELPTGMYIVLMVTPEYTKSIKMVLLK